MLNDRDWIEIRTAVDEVINRDHDRLAGRFGIATREPDGSVHVVLEHKPWVGALDLEPVDDHS